MTFHKIAIPKGARRIGPLAPGHEIAFTVVLSAKASLPSIHTARPGSPHLTHEQLRSRYGAVAGSVAVVESFAREHALKITETAEHRRSIQLKGRAADIARAFKTEFAEFELNGHKFFAPVRLPSAPRNWNGVVDLVFGLHNLRRATPRRHPSMHSRKAQSRLHDLARAYAFPPGHDGAGQTIGLIEFDGGFYPEDIEQFCASLGILRPRITVVKAGGGANRPASRRAIHQVLEAFEGELRLAAGAEESDSFLAAQSTIEVTMDLEILAALAPAAHIVVYFASVDGQGLYHAISRAVHDEKHRPGVLSVSWSLPEHEVPQSELEAIEGVLHEAAHLGITVCVSSGDQGALNGSPDKPSVNYPASSPHCLACGGTSGRIDKSGISEEIVWNALHFGVRGASGGGVSQLFPLPPWQRGARVPLSPAGKKGRGVPDVAGLADPRDGCELLVAGRTFASSGTSAVAPVWAALVARLNQALKRRCGHLHPHLYRLGAERAAALRPVVKGNNGLYSAREGWNACTGNGTPRGKELLADLRKNRD